MKELKYTKINFPNYKKFMESKSYTNQHYETRYNEYNGEKYTILAIDKYINCVKKGSYSIRLKTETGCGLLGAYINETICRSFENTEFGYNEAVKYLEYRHYQRCEEMLLKYKF